ncbi:unnamed protein product [Symbiodinium sp. CCMP2592]|nr:unnamed protein product [Symbiodinium sp. CCMP2592]
MTSCFFLSLILILIFILINIICLIVQDSAEPSSSSSKRRKKSAEACPTSRISECVAHNAAKMSLAGFIVVIGNHRETEKATPKERRALASAEDAFLSDSSQKQTEPKKGEPSELHRGDFQSPVVVSPSAEDAFVSAVCVDLQSKLLEFPCQDSDQKQAELEKLKTSSESSAKDALVLAVCVGQQGKLPDPGDPEREPCEASEAEEDDTEVFTEPDEHARQMMLQQASPLDKTISATESRHEELAPQMRGGKRVAGQRQQKQFTLERSLRGAECRREYQIPAAAFERLFKDIASQVTSDLEEDVACAAEALALEEGERGKRRRGRPCKKESLAFTVPQFQKKTIRLAHHMCEDFLQGMFSDSHRLSQHAKRSTTTLRDLRLAAELRAGAMQKHSEDNEFRVMQSILAERRRRVHPLKAQGVDRAQAVSALQRLFFEALAAGEDANGAAALALRRLLDSQASVPGEVPAARSLPLPQVGINPKASRRRPEPEGCAVRAVAVET